MFHSRLITRRGLVVAELLPGLRPGAPVLLSALIAFGHRDLIDLAIDVEVRVAARTRVLGVVHDRGPIDTMALSDLHAIIAHRRHDDFVNGRHVHRRTVLPPCSLIGKSEVPPVRGREDVAGWTGCAVVPAAAVAASDSGACASPVPGRRPPPDRPGPPPRHETGRAAAPGPAGPRPGPQGRSTGPRRAGTG